MPLDNLTMAATALGVPASKVIEGATKLEADTKANRNAVAMVSQLARLLDPGELNRNANE